MNINSLLENLSVITGLEVAPDIYDGTAESYIVYSLSSEFPVLFGDDRPLADTATMQVNLYTPPQMNYMELKHQIRDYLETFGEVDSIGSWIDTWTSKNNLEVIKRHTAFTVDITRRR